MIENPPMASDRDPRDRCGHECLNGADCEGPHHYGYRLGPDSHQGMVLRLGEAEMRIVELIGDHERMLTEFRYELDQLRSSGAIGVGAYFAVSEALKYAGGGEE